MSRKQICISKFTPLKHQQRSLQYNLNDFSKKMCEKYIKILIHILQKPKIIGKPLLKDVHKNNERRYEFNYFLYLKKNFTTLNLLKFFKMRPIYIQCISKQFFSNMMYTIVIIFIFSNNFYNHIITQTRRLKYFYITFL